MSLHVWRGEGGSQVAKHLQSVAAWLCLERCIQRRLSKGSCRRYSPQVVSLCRFPPLFCFFFSDFCFCCTLTSKHLKWSITAIRINWRGSRKGQRSHVICDLHRQVFLVFGCGSCLDTSSLISVLLLFLPSKAVFTLHRENTQEDLSWRTNSCAVGTKPMHGDLVSIRNIRGPVGEWHS